MKRIIFTVCAAIILIGCTKTTPCGHVVKMKENPERVESYYNVVLKMPSTRVVPKTFIIWIDNGDDICKVQVNEATYKALNVGFYYTPIR